MTDFSEKKGREEEESEGGLEGSLVASWEEWHWEWVGGFVCRLGDWELEPNGGVCRTRSRSCSCKRNKASAQKASRSEANADGPSGPCPNL